MAKRIVVSENKAYRIESIELGGKQMVSVRQLYKTKNDDTWKPAKAGITLNLDEVKRIAKAMVSISEGDEFKAIEK